MFKTSRSITDKLAVLMALKLSACEPRLAESFTLSEPFVFTVSPGGTAEAIVTVHGDLSDGVRDLDLSVAVDPVRPFQVPKRPVALGLDCGFPDDFDWASEVDLASLQHAFGTRLKTSEVGFDGSFVQECTVTAAAREDLPAPYAFTWTVEAEARWWPRDEPADIIVTIADP